jgi:hypothetical protein
MGSMVSMGSKYNRMVVLPGAYHTLSDSMNPKRTQLVFPQVCIAFIYYGTTIVQYLWGCKHTGIYMFI